eukprot:4072544-Prymnesium_polylepis.1
MLVACAFLSLGFTASHAPPLDGRRVVLPRVPARCCAAEVVKPVAAAQEAVEPPPLPDGAVLRNFALPALVLWIGSPILSLIDTSAVGLSAPPGASATQARDVTGTHAVACCQSSSRHRCRQHPLPL